MLKVLRKKSSPDKSASLARNSSLRSSSNGASNDTSTDPILELKFKYFQDMLGTLKKHGDIPLKEYEDLHKNIQKSELSATDKNLLLFKICEDKADIAWQKGKFSTHEKSLKDMFNIDVPFALIALERWHVEYKKNINENAKSCIKDIETLYKESLIKIKEEVNSLLNGKKPELNSKKYDKAVKKYDEVVKKLEYLAEHSNNFQIFAMHAKIFIKQGDDLVANGKTSVAKEYYKNAYQYCKSKLSIDKDGPYYVIHDTFKELADKLTVVGNTELAAEATTYASKYKPNPVKILIEQGDGLADAGNKLEAKECYEKAYQDCKSKLSKDKDVPYDVIHDTFKVLEDKLSIVGDKKLAAEAASYASKYKPNASAALSVNPVVRQAGKELEKRKDKYEEASNKYERVLTLAEQEEQIKEIKAKYEAQLKDELEKVNTVFNTKLEALKASYTKVEVDETGDSSIPSAPPPYDYIAGLAGHSYLRLAKNAPTAPIDEVVPPLAEEVLAEVVPPLAPEVLAELTELAHLIPSLSWRDYKYDFAKAKAKSLLSEAINKTPDVHETITDSKILVLLADALLSLNKMEKARIVCERALELEPNIWEATNNQIVLLNLAGVLLSSDQPKAEQIYHKAITAQDFSKCQFDPSMYNIVSRTVAQNQYTDAERDYLAKICLSSPKVFYKAQALDCYPHTYVTKRQEIAKQLQQFAKQEPKPGPGEYRAYTLCSKAFSALKNDQELLQDMKAIYDATNLMHYPCVYPYPPTEESTAYLVGEVMYPNNY
ncbi:tetratricopeptide repeat protein [Candidatus Tisiphia endosymbiont of Micropterix aruncella]|uniref:tetratricopeptide repeat protein n=1 Tax=Candidatus Tisiphia endosymbiont of Micropterix aruncella TaxID=3066271 RepID=UPI003AA7C9CF